ncbi:FAD-binding oxidoreductase [Pseudomonas leptonychotis]|uniref:FAD-binding oxidoreductase n=1 Tax=Pseudomonas leptonychotis TaxID=2448482 RepID=A0A4T2A5T1_9PSED|nr:FAD-binding oxidoreductase [Pseudomonas leptonychotis]TIH10601.1 FAD-binding oxidoreductase [Pseudomonas leptonychotis]
MLTHGWGRYPRHAAQLMQPQSVRDAIQQLGEHGALLGRGMGRSYGDSALADKLISTRQLNRLYSFDEQSGLLACAAGISLGELLDVFVPRGWFLPITPGTKFVSIGGAIASDVHGKNHHVHGCFSECVDSIELLLGDGSQVTCSRSERPELFHASCGGMGLTGLIVAATLRLLPIESAYIKQTTYKAANLEAVLQLFEAHAAATYSVAWIDCLASGAALGRSLLMLGEHARDGQLVLPGKPRLSVPLDMPSFLLNRFSVHAFNELYYQRIRRHESKQRVSYESFFYPLDGIQQWNRLYGKQGFVQYQFVIPKAAGLEGMRAILERISASHRGSFLAVLKAFGAANDNLLSFPMDGYTLALDFKLEAGLLTLLEELDRMVLDYGGRLYLAKDARMSEATFKQSQPNWQHFQEVRAQYGALGKFASLQSRRLGLD